MSVSHAKKMGLLSIAAVAVSLVAVGASAEAGSLTGPRRPVMKKLANGKSTYVTPGSTSDPVSDFGLGISGNIGPGGVTVEGIDFGSPAERVGLERGDVLLTVNGIAICNVDDWIAAMRGRSTASLRIRDVRNPGGPPVIRFVNLNP